MPSDSPRPAAGLSLHESSSVKKPRQRPPRSSDAFSAQKELWACTFCSLLPRSHRTDPHPSRCGVINPSAHPRPCLMHSSHHCSFARGSTRAAAAAWANADGITPLPNTVRFPSAVQKPLLLCHRPCFAQYPPCMTIDRFLGPPLSTCHDMLHASCRTNT